MKVGIAAGDPAGIGLEVVFKALPRLPSDAATWFLYVHRSDFEACRERFGLSVPWRLAKDAADAATGGLQVVFMEGGDSALEPGRASHEGGRRALTALEAASGAALAGALDALVTAPLGKRWVGNGFRDHTSFLAARAGCDLPLMTFFAPTLKVVLATTHHSLRGALDALSVDLYQRVLHAAARALSRLGMERPRIAVAAVNPHAGEGGLFGDEEDAILGPAVRSVRQAGVDVSGPHPADSVYQRAHAGEFDLVVAPYHDQGLIPVKLMAPRSASHVTLGLPYVRTSPDHGTALDIAGRGVADAGGMEAAMRCAVDLAHRTRAARAAEG